MNQPTTQQKSTPGRRRHNRHPSQSAANRTYASENDMPTELQFPVELSSGSPFTPRKSTPNSPGPGSQPANSKTKPRTGTKNRPKNVTTSPGPPKRGRHTPPHTATVKPTTTTAFAGATFHASPAPSSLPIPSFLAKALDSPALKDSGRLSQEPSPPPTDSEAAPTPVHHRSSASISTARREESPLDLFFRADREEKERARRASSANIASSSEADGPFSPPSDPQSPQEPRTFPRGPNAQQNRRPGFLRASSSGISAAELDGTPGRPIGPAFSTPYQERMQAVRYTQKKVTQLPMANQEQAPHDKSDALKKFLAIGQASPSPATKNAPTQEARVPLATTTQTTQSTTAYVQHFSTNIPQHASAESGRPQDILLMENSLRRILKLDSGLSFGSTTPLANARSS